MTTALEGGERSASPSVALYPRERPGTHCTGGWVGSRAGLHRCGKSRLPPGFDPRTVQPVASRYTDFATRLTKFLVVLFKCCIRHCPLEFTQHNTLLNSLLRQCDILNNLQLGQQNPSLSTRVSVQEYRSILISM